MDHTPLITDLDCGQRPIGSIESMAYCDKRRPFQPFRQPLHAVGAGGLNAIHLVLRQLLATECLDTSEERRQRLLKSLGRERLDEGTA